MKYDLTIFTPSREPVLHIKYLVRMFGWELNLHKIVASDEVGCYHTHPAKAWRLILWGGYAEEILEEWEGLTPTYKVKRSVGHFSRIVPTFEHRIDYLFRKASYTLWLRAPITAKITTRGC